MIAIFFKDQNRNSKKIQTKEGHGDGEDSIVTMTMIMAKAVVIDSYWMFLCILCCFEQFIFIIHTSSLHPNSGVWSSSWLSFCVVFFLSSFKIIGDQDYKGLKIIKMF